MSKLNSFIIDTELVKEDRKFKRTAESYKQLLSDYLAFERDLETLDNLQYTWENALVCEKYFDDKVFVRVTSSIDELLEKIDETSKICTDIYNSSSKEKSYSLFKENFDKIKGYELPETNEIFQDYLLDYYARVIDIVARRWDISSKTDLSTLLGFDVEHTPGYQ